MNGFESTFVTHIDHLVYIVTTTKSFAYSTPHGLLGSGKGNGRQLSDGPPGYHFWTTCSGPCLQSGCKHSESKQHFKKMYVDGRPCTMSITYTPNLLKTGKNFRFFLLK